MKKVLLALACALICAPPSNAEIALDENNLFFLYGDGRVRFEKDWDSYRSDGTQRSDRSRLRIRARLGLRLKPTDWLKFDVRARTGNDDQQQSGHITVIDFNGNDRGASDVNLDKWFAQVNWNGLIIWGGRNSFQTWKQNELLWDDDVTPRGFGLAYKTKIGPGALTWNSGIYELPVGMRDYTGDAWNGQLVWELDNNQYGYSIAGGVQRIKADAKPGDYADRTLLQGNALRDYENWALRGQWRRNDLPQAFYIGFDYLYNNENYVADDPDEFTAFHRDDNEGWVVQSVYGDVKKRGNWMAGVAYAYIEALALHNSYAQDDWVRWGNSDQTTSSNFKGLELTSGIGLGWNANIIARLFIVRAIDKEFPDSARKQTGKRFRVDANISF